ncbi:TPA: hypothetical protein QDB15_006480 [Burkholderia vietnamiensis]|uniref:Transmembrane protein n=1 Tax=Burkholderia vietnamiensis TaxID=60552 RepID=A0AA45BFI4_BURVI|nr:hypothetical protein WK32_11385 [Burkholderia vietnamiensis]PRH43932.1 hypothetical protein C6T65_02320 [Burkholderia vietnamiensis]HDR9021137.1 hypothetical protein [Burkholderia vietnamiensis]HDR9102773.1 hypothetical protein [Burkholderia vietnamiensis]HDR9122586.1 hypothetical protein [Burkholderia vietnamiensis]
MSWPIPTLTSVSYPKPPELRVWVPGLLALAVGAAGALLLLWPHGKSTHGLQFWGLLIGAPLVSCAIALGIRLDRWEREQTAAEELEREQERIMSLWQSWCRRHVCVTASVAILPILVPAAGMREADADLPVNRGRASTFPWSKNKTLKQRREKLLNQIAEKLQVALAERKELRVKLVVADAPEESLLGWKADAEDALCRFAPACKFKIDTEPAVDCASFLTQQVDLVGTEPHLLITVQIWPDSATRHTFSEGAAALLMESADEEPGRVFRPMISTADARDADLKQLVQMQLSPDHITHAWFSRCEAESGAITAAFTTDTKVRPIERSFDHIVGEAGPATSWIALATAYEASKEGEPHLVAWREPGDEVLHLCIVRGAQPKKRQKEI